MATKTTTRKELFKCPACEDSIFGDFSIDLEVDVPGGANSVTATGTVTGVRVNHDCIPKVTRGGSGVTPERGCFT